MRPAATGTLAPAAPVVRPLVPAVPAIRPLAPAVPAVRPLFGKRILEERLPAAQLRAAADDWFVLLDADRTQSGIVAGGLLVVLLVLRFKPTCTRLLTRFQPKTDKKHTKTELSRGSSGED